MKRWIALVLLAALSIWQGPLQAQGRLYSQAELDALLAPVALYPDPVLSQILVAATYPDDLRDAAAWSRANPQLSGEDAVRAAEPMLWHPSVKALVAFPDLLARMDESPQWTADLGAAFREQEPYVMDTVQALRQRAQASGYLQSNDQYSVQQQGPSIAVYPAQPQVVYVPYYDPYVVYGPWPWFPYRPVFWRPWHPRPAVFVSTGFFVSSVDWRHRHVRRIHRIQPAVPVTIHNHAHPVRPIVDSVRIQAQLPTQPRREIRREFHRDHAIGVRPIGEPVRPIGIPVRPIGMPVRPMADSAGIPRPAAHPRQTEPRREFHREPRAQASPPVMVQNQALRPIADPVRTYQQQTARAARPVVESSARLQPQAVHIPPQRSAQTYRSQVRSEFQLRGR
jgi:Protein of unknown function (DUF3300)